MTGYATVADLYAYGLQRGALANPGRLAASVNATTNTIALDQHGLALNDVLTLRAESGSLPAPLQPNVQYYAVPVNDGAFSVAATPGGAVIDLTTAGTRTLVITPINFAAAIAFGAALLDDVLPAHIVPLESPYPPIVVMTNAELAIWKLTGTTGNGSKSLSEMVTEARKRMAEWAKGRPVRGANTPEPANLAATAVATTPARACRSYLGPGGSI